MKHQFKRRRGRGPNNTGRSRRGERFVKLTHWMLKCPAWCELSTDARALYVELAQRYNGFNNGEISMSVREAARVLHVAKDTATKTFHGLEEKGFIKRNVCGSFNWKLRHNTAHAVARETYVEYALFFDTDRPRDTYAGLAGIRDALSAEELKDYCRIA